jgi:hypothetical protein
VVVAETNVTPDGKVSPRLTFVATAGPLLVAVIRYESGTPTCPGFGDAVFVTDKSALAGFTTLNVACVECAVEPDCALMSNKWLPTGMFALVVTVSVAVFELASVMLTGVGLKTALAPVGRLATLRFTFPVNPASGVTVTV